MGELGEDGDSLIMGNIWGRRYLGGGLIEIERCFENRLIWFGEGFEEGVG